VSRAFPGIRAFVEAAVPVGQKAAEALEAQLDAERTHYERLLKALAGAQVVLDAACGFVINR